MHESIENIKEINDDSAPNSRYNQRNSKPSAKSDAQSIDQQSMNKSSIVESESAVYYAYKMTASQQSRRTSIKLAKSRFSKTSRKFPPEHILMLRKKFIKAANLLMKCISWCKWAYKKNTELRDMYLSFSQMFDFELQAEKSRDENLLENAIRNPNFVYFNKDYYKAKKSERKSLGSDIQDTLTKRSTERSKNEIETLRIIFKNNKAVASLPNEMQMKIFKKCWLEVIEPKRVVIRQGHSPAAFYFIISGSLVVTNRPENSTTSFTVCFLEAGQSFGELALLSRSLRTSTVITRNRVELLVIAKDDFFRIFGSEKTELLLLNKEKTDSMMRENTIVDPGELSNIHFLKKLKFLNGWSFDTLVKNPTQLLFSYFPRGQVLVRHGNSSKYIYIVKKGTISVWIKITRPKNKFNDQNTVRKYLSVRKSDFEEFSDEPKHAAVKAAAHKHADIAIVSKLGSATSYFISDDYLKDQHHEAIGIKHHDKKVAHHKKHHHQHQHLSKEQLESKSRMHYLTEYIAMIKGSHGNAIEVKVTKGDKIMPGVLDKRDKLKILDTQSEKEQTFNEDNLSDILETHSLTSQQNNEELRNVDDAKTFTKGLLHLPNITVEKVQKRKSINSLTGSLNSRRGSMYIAKLPAIAKPFMNRRSYEIPKNQFKTTIELMEASEANDDDDLAFKVKKNQTLLPVFQSSTPFANLPAEDYDLPPLEENDEYITEYIQVQILESGSQFGLAEILFESQPDMTLISNGCDCILLSKELFIQNATTTYIRELRKQIIPYPTFNEILRSYNESTSWKQYSSELARNVIVNTKRHKRNEELKTSREQTKRKIENYLIKSTYF